MKKSLKVNTKKYGYTTAVNIDIIDIFNIDYFINEGLKILNKIKINEK